MFYWPESGGDHVTKAEILRGVVAEKLTTAAREILAVVERTVSGYEHEAAGFRREIDRQKKQLELLLQPRVSLQRTALVPDEEAHEVVLGEEEEQQSAVEDTGSLGLLWFDDDADADDDEERAASSSRWEDLKDPDYQTSPSCRAVPPRVWSDRRRPGRPCSSDTPGLVVLRICILEDSRTAVLSNTVFQKYPVREVRCHRGLREEDFLDLLRSTFPQLETQRPFDIFTSDRTKTLQPLEVAALTPEQICMSIRLSGRGNSALYIRLKRGADPQSSSEALGGLHRPAAGSPPGSATMSADETEAVTGRSFNEEAGGGPPGVSHGLLCPSVPSDRRRGRGRPRLGEEPTHHVLRVCVLEDSRVDVLPHKVMDKYPVQEVRCPRGLQEEDFLDLLRSTFPQLEPQKPFDVFKSDRSRRLQRLVVKTLTPEEILRTRSPGDKSLIYIRLKTAEEAELHLSQRTDEGATMKSEAEQDSSSGQHIPAQQQEVETQEAVEDEDGGEALDGDDNWEPESPQTSKTKSKSLRKQGAEEENAGKKACQVCGIWYRATGSLIKHAWSHVDEPSGACGVCGERFESAESLKGHLKKYKKTHDCSYCRKSFITANGLKVHTTLHTGNRPFKCDVCGKAFARMSSLRDHRWVHSEEKPYECDLCPKAFSLRTQLRTHATLHTGRDRYRCSVCGKSLFDRRSLTRHKATHSGERRHGCGVCGKRFKLSCALKSHEKTHTVRERPFLCHVCCKTFVASGTLRAHMRRHSGERPFACTVCDKSFSSSGERTVHMRVHTGEAPYGCSECGRFFKRKTHLSNHERSHRGIKLFVCTVCGKPCARQEHLTVHMRTHNGERPYECSVCDKAFTQSHCLKTHMRSHGAGPVPERTVKHLHDALNAP
ncbi:uncharacterized protein [Clinocottus analis]|uniref:uncharacterized protein n=1 Tax=Clinocottus analis TaxID=304258 RepID=UPI0035BF1929